MAILVPHPKCRELPRVHRTSPMILKFIMINAKNTPLISQDVNQILKHLKKRSFYRALTIASKTNNIIERNYILQILYSIATYSENNHSTDLLKLWIEDIYLKKTINSNQFIDKSLHNLNCNNNLIIKLGFQYKTPPIKPEPLW